MNYLLVEKYSIPDGEGHTLTFRIHVTNSKSKEAARYSVSFNGGNIARDLLSVDAARSEIYTCAISLLEQQKGEMDKKREVIDESLRRLFGSVKDFWHLAQFQERQP